MNLAERKILGTRLCTRIPDSGPVSSHPALPVVPGQLAEMEDEHRAHPVLFDHPTMVKLGLSELHLDKVKNTSTCASHLFIQSKSTLGLSRPKCNVSGGNKSYT